MAVAGKKTNPLFVDSTLFHGDNINTRLELSGLLLYPDEVAWARLTIADRSQASGQVVLDVLLQSRADGLFVGTASLRHQQMLEVQFYLVRDGQVFLAGRPFETAATYVLSRVWEPDRQAILPTLQPAGLDSFAPPATESSSRPSRSPRPDAVAEETQMLATLMERWGF